MSAARHTERSGRRSARVANLLREELAGLVRRELDDPRVETLTVTGVQVTDDLRHARVQVSTLGPSEEREAVVALLTRAAPYLRQVLAGRLELRRMPELAFEYDTALEEGLRISRLLAEIAEEEGEDEPGGGEDSR